MKPSLSRRDFVKLSAAMLAALIIENKMNNAFGLSPNLSLSNSEKTIRFLSLNCWGLPFLPGRSGRMQAIGNEIGSGKYDVIGLQEIWSRDDWMIVSGLARKGGLNYSAYYPSGAIGSGLGIISKFPIIDTEFKRFNVCGKPQNIFHGDYYGGKGIALARIATNAGEIDVYTTHFIAKYSQKDEYFAHRIAQAVDLVKFVSSTQKNNLSVVLGDINSEADSSEYQIISKLGNFTDCFNLLNPNDAGYTTSDSNSYTPNGRNRRIDYIFVKSTLPVGYSILQSEVTMKFMPNSDNSFSDHFGVFAALENKILQSQMEKEDIPLERQVLQNDLISKTMNQIDEGIKDAKWRQGMHTNKAIAGLLSIPLSQKINKDVLTNSKFGKTIENMVEFFAPIYSFSELYLALSFTNEEIHGLELVRSYLVSLKD
ncbi:MAG: endonuclease/exonuclease/phosphatase family protein [Anaerolineae bacterium]|nr:endonuclease/exonuclease/phosphatase family protein [Anaerolineae bacterium]